MKFNSQVCTTREQSERLLALGLKKETADMALVENWDWSEEDGKYFTGEYFERPIDYVEGLIGKWIPAWSIHRLVEILGQSPYPIYLDSNAYDDIIDDIEDAIRQSWLVTHIEQKR